MDNTQQTPAPATEPVRSNRSARRTVARRMRLRRPPVLRVFHDGRTTDAVR